MPNENDSTVAEAAADGRAAAREEAQGGERTFTQEEVNRLVASAKAKERQRYADYDELKAKASRFDDAEAARAAEAERAGWVASVAKETGVPADVLALFAAESADDLKAKADGVAGEFRRDQLPVVPGDGGRPGKGDVGADDMRSFVRQLMGTGN